MGEYFKVVNIDKRQFFSGHALGMSVKFSGLEEMPLASMLVWVLTKRSGFDPHPFLGAWADDRVVVAGDEGPNEPINADAEEYEDVSVALIECWIRGDVFRGMDYWEKGLLDDNGRYVVDRKRNEELRKTRQGKEFPFDDWAWWCANAT